ncbi:hypothetical protein HPP92_006713 [Vanilla planifolia]|uniref:Folylpolyglutamate synthase n=1 Tax=Vanilla planifolia TaxID=51239 RepID=A0A835RL00_VANPL|nr:hypothetical protein HPP92_006713 [Vanilla planifolia]
MVFAYMQPQRKEGFELDQQCITELKIIHIAGTKGKIGYIGEKFLMYLGNVGTSWRTKGSEGPTAFYLYADLKLPIGISLWRCVGRRVSLEKVDGFVGWRSIKTKLVYRCVWSVDVAILEVGLGGRLDSTNVVKEPVVCGITSLGMDHTEILGDTIAKIASEKAGIFKSEVPAFTVPQLPEAMSVLNDRASTLSIPLEVAKPLSPNMLKGVHLGLAGHHQFTNAGLAVAICRCWLQRTGRLNFFPNDNEVLPEAFLKGLWTACLFGRAQIVHDKQDNCPETPEIGNGSGNLVFYLDGAHTPESMEVCARWFSSAARDDLYSPLENGHFEKTNCQKNFKNENNYRVLNKVSQNVFLFNCMEVRDPHVLFPQLINICAANGIHFSKALFVPSISTYHKVDSGAPIVSFDITQDVSWQFTLQKIWEKIIHDSALDGFDNSERYAGLPTWELLSEGLSQKCDPANQKFTCSAVIPSLPMAIKSLRDCVKESPSLRLQVLVTGSLHLVGDVLKLLKR